MLMFRIIIYNRFTIFVLLSSAPNLINTMSDQRLTINQLYIFFVDVAFSTNFMPPTKTKTTNLILNHAINNSEI